MQSSWAEGNLLLALSARSYPLLSGGQSRAHAGPDGARAVCAHLGGAQAGGAVGAVALQAGDAGEEDQPGGEGRSGGLVVGRGEGGLVCLGRAGQGRAGQGRRARKQDRGSVVPRALVRVVFGRLLQNGNCLSRGE